MTYSTCPELMVNHTLIIYNKSVVIYNHSSGYENQLLDADKDVWITGMSQHSVKSPAFYSRNFKSKCDQLLKDFYGITNQLQITTENFEQVYSFILQNY